MLQVHTVTARATGGARAPPYLHVGDTRGTKHKVDHDTREPMWYSHQILTPIEKISDDALSNHRGE